MSRARVSTALLNVAENKSVWQSGRIWPANDRTWEKSRHKGNREEGQEKTESTCGSNPNSNILSASSNTRYVHLERRVVLKSNFWKYNNCGLKPLHIGSFFLDHLN